MVVPTTKSDIWTDMKSQSREVSRIDTNMVEQERFADAVVGLGIGGGNAPLVDPVELQLVPGDRVGEGLGAVGKELERGLRRGSAGDGYCLIERMGLTEDKLSYNAIVVCFFIRLELMVICASFSQRFTSFVSVPVLNGRPRILVKIRKNLCEFLKSYAFLFLILRFKYQGFLRPVNVTHF